MQTQNTHIIQQQIFEVSTPSKDQAMALHQQFTDIYYREILPQIEEVFSRIAGPDTHIRLDKVVLSLPPIPLDKLPGSLGPKVIEAIQKALDHALRDYGTKNETSLSKRDAVCETFVFFLQTGRLPWWSNPSLKSAAFFEAEILGSVQELPEKWKSKLQQLFARESKALLRLASQFSEEVFMQVIKLMVPNRRPNELIYLLQTETGRSLLQQEIQQYALDQEAKRILPKELSKKEEPPTLVEEGIYVSFAGVVLLHPFLPTLFQASNLLDESQQFFDLAAQVKAIHLLYFLATGTPNPAEHELVLLKFLCGYPLEEPVKKFLSLTLVEKAEAGELLTSVIGQWPALKNTGMATFRDGFLARAGKLSQVDSGWRLVVEPKTQDVLMSKLPWGIGIIRLPWMPELLYVDWM